MCLKISLWSLLVAVLVCVGRLFCVAGWQGLRGGVCALVCKRYGFALRKVWFCRAKGNLLEGERYGFGKPPFFCGHRRGRWRAVIAAQRGVEGAYATQEAGRCAGLRTRPASLKLLLFNCLLAAIGARPCLFRGGGCALLAGSLGAFALRRCYFLTTFTVRPLLIRTMFSPFCGPAMARPSAL